MPFAQDLASVESHFSLLNFAGRGDFFGFVGVLGAECLTGEP